MIAYLRIKKAQKNKEQTKGAVYSCGSPADIVEALLGVGLHRDGLRILSIKYMKVSVSADIIPAGVPAEFPVLCESWG